MTIYDKSQGQRNAFEQVLAKIPGFRGYLNKEWRRESDKLERDFIAKAFDNARAPLRDASRLASDGGGFEGMKVVTALDNLDKLIDKIGNRVRFADYGYSGFFDTIKVDEAALERLYQFDLALYERAEALDRRCREVPKLAKDAGQLASEVAAIEQMARDIDRDFDQRKRLITG